MEINFPQGDWRADKTAVVVRRGKTEAVPGKKSGGSTLEIL